MDSNQWKKALVMPFIAALTWQSLPAQSLHIGAGARLVMSGSPSIVLNNMGLIAESPISPGNSTVVFTGNADTTVAIISGGPVSNPSFNNLTIAKSAGDVRAVTGMTIGGTLNMQQGNIRLSSNSISLGTSGAIANESEASHITGSGNVTATSFIPANTDFDTRVGLTVNSPVSIGTSFIFRLVGAHYATGPHGSIARAYSVVPVTGSKPTNVTVSLQYLVSELNGNDENALLVWSRTSFADFQQHSNSVVNTKAKTVTLGGLDTLYIVTLAEGGASSSRVMAASAAGNTGRQSFSLKVMPNPVRDQLVLTLSANAGNKDVISLYDMTGHLLQSKAITYPAGTTNIEWDISAHAAGIYYIRLEKQATATVQIIKQ